MRLFDALAVKVSRNDSSMTQYGRLLPSPPVMEATEPKAPINRKEIVLLFPQLIDGETTLFAETGDSWFNGVQMDLLRGAKFEAEMQWGHIG